MSLAGFKSRNHPQQIARRGADDTTDDRRTPPEIFGLLHAEFCFTIDVAASRDNTQCGRFFDLSEDGLRASWRAESVWCNPPYSDISAWVHKAWAEMRNGCDLVVMLLPANRTEQKWWQEMVEPYRDRCDDTRRIHLTTRFLQGRPRFNRPGWTKPAKGDRPPFGLCLLVWERGP